MANDYSLDPLEIEEQQLKERQARANAMALRNTGLPIFDATMGAFNQVGSAFENVKIDKERKDLARRADAQFEETLKGVDPQIAALLRNPQTRDTGKAMLLADQQRKQDDAEDERDRARRKATTGALRAPVSGEGMGNILQRVQDTGSAAAPGPSEPTYGGHTYPELMEMLNSNSKRKQDKAKRILDQAKPVDPSHSGFRSDQGITIDPTLSAEAQRQAAVKWAAEHPAGQEKRNAMGGYDYVGNGQPSQPPQPAPAPAPRQPEYRSGYVDSPPSPSVPPAPNAPASSPPGPVSELTPGNRSVLFNSVAAADGGGQGWGMNFSEGAGESGKQGGGQPPPVRQEGGPKGMHIEAMKAMLQDPNVPMEQKEQIAATLGKMGVKFNANTGDKAPPPPQAPPSALQGAVNAAPPPQGPGGLPSSIEMASGARMPPPQALPQSNPQPQAPPPQAPPPMQPQAAPPPMQPQAGPVPPAPVGIQQPTTGQHNPVRVKSVEGAMTTSDNVNQAAQIGQKDFGKLLGQVAQLEKLNAGETYSGPTGWLEQKGEGAWAGVTRSDTSDKYNRTREMQVIIEDMKAGILKDYGAREPSNLDLAAAAARGITLEDSPSARKAILAQLRRGIEAELYVTQETQRRLDMGRNSPEINAQQYQNVRQQVWMEYNAKNHPDMKPGPGGTWVKKDQAPSALSGAVGAANAATPTQNQGPQNRPKDEPQGGGGFGAYMGDVVNNAKTVFPSIFSSSGLDAAWDAGMNTGEGIRQLVGLGNYDKYAATKDEQEKRKASDPKYNQARHFFDVVESPSSYLGGGSTSLVKLGMAGAAGGLLEPTKNFAEKGGNAAIGAITSAAGGLAGKFLPSTKVAADIAEVGEPLKRQFSGVKLNSAQLNPSPYDSKIAASMGINRAATKDQTIQLSKDIMKQTGIPGEQITREGIDEAYKAIKAEANQLFPAKAIVRTSTSDGKKLEGIIRNTPTVQDAMVKGGPELNQVAGQLLSGAPTDIPLKTLYGAWQSVGKTGMGKAEAAEVRELIENMAVRKMPGNGFPYEKLEQFKAFANKEANLADVDRAWSSGTAGGKGPLAGYLDLSKIREQAAKGNREGIISQASKFIDTFGLETVKNDKLEQIMYLLGNKLAPLGPIAQKYEKYMPQPESGWSKALVEGLRRSITHGAPSVIQEERTNAP